jgi:hypothetical protein
MEIGATATTEVTELGVSVSGGVGADAEGFGTRPLTDRPHSLSLFGTDRSPAHDGTSRGLDVLLGVGIGAAAMYYFDPDGGPRRRALARDRIVGAVTMAPDVFEVTAHDVGRWAREGLETQGRGLSHLSRHAGPTHWTPGARLVASVLGGALTLLASRRRDALGAAFGIVGSALLARGVSEWGRGASSRSEVPSEPVTRELSD